MFGAWWQNTEEDGVVVRDRGGGRRTGTTVGVAGAGAGDRVGFGVPGTSGRRCWPSTWRCASGCGQGGAGCRWRASWRRQRGASGSGTSNSRSRPRCGAFTVRCLGRWTWRRSSPRRRGVVANDSQAGSGVLAGAAVGGRRLSRERPGPRRRTRAPLGPRVPGKRPPIGGRGPRHLASGPGPVPARRGWQPEGRVGGGPDLAEGGRWDLLW